VRPEGLSKFKNSPHRVLNPRMMMKLIIIIIIIIMNYTLFIVSRFELKLSVLGTPDTN
jgi:hypothetical protein